MIAPRIREFGRTLWLGLGYGVLVSLWGVMFAGFTGRMLARLHALWHSGAAAGVVPCDGSVCDFSIFWEAGLLARQGRLQTLYSPDAFFAVRQALHIAHAWKEPWFYPPPSLLALMPISHLPLGPAYVVWVLVLTLLGLLVLRVAKLSWPAILVSLVSPAMVYSVEAGQWESLCGCLLVTGLLLQARKPMVSGLLLSLMLFKPQAGWSVPIALLAAGRWRVILAGIAGGAVLCGLTTLVMGWGVWQAWLSHGLAAAYATLISAHGMSTSVFWALRSLGIGVKAAQMAQLAAEIVAMAVVALAWRSTVLPELERVAIAVIAGTLMVPYFFVHDLVAYEIVLALLAERSGWRIGLLDAVLWLWPMLGTVIFLQTGLPVTPLVMVVALLRVGLPPLIGSGAALRLCVPVLPRAAQE